MKKILLTIAVFACTLFFAQKSENYLSVGYASVCCGPPSDKPVRDFLSRFKSKNKLKNLEIYKQTGLGREGEYNLYIGTDFLSRTQKAGLIKGLKGAVETQNRARTKDSDGMVNFNEEKVVKKTDLSRARNLTPIK